MYKRQVEAFAREHGVEVEVLFQTRSKIEELLSGNYKGEEPSLVYSTEWPFVGSGIQDLTDLVSIGDYQDAAITYWTDAGKIMGIPSYVHWPVSYTHLSRMYRPAKRSPSLTVRSFNSIWLSAGS